MNSTSMPLGSVSESESELSRLIKSFSAARGDGDRLGALRLIDRAWRTAPLSPEINFLYGRLRLAEGALEHAIKLLKTAAAGRIYPDYEAAYISALCAGGQLDLAQSRAEAALAGFATVPDGPLAQSARQVVLASGSNLSGWVGIGPDLAVHGEIIGKSGDVKLEIAGDSSAPAAHWIKCGRRRSTTPFDIPADAIAGHTTIRVHDKVLLGGKLDFPPDFGLDGRMMLDKERIFGWLTLKWDPQRQLEVTVSGQNGFSMPVITTADPAHLDRHAFSFRRDLCKLAGNALTIGATMPNGSLQELPASPFLIRPTNAPALRRTQPANESRVVGPLPSPGMPQRPIDIIIPVYSGIEETLACIRSVIATAGREAEIIVIDDASPDPEMKAALGGAAAAGTITLLRNPQNLGFPGAANRGLLLHPDRDVVILNADTEVYGDWLRRLRAAAYSKPGIATVTPLTNSGSIATYPASEDSGLASEPAAAIDRLAADVNNKMTVDIPTGVGFCLFIRRESLDEIGYFDAELFVKGYGEENDLCMRAVKAGWKHVLAPNIYVRHSGSRSFGGRRAALYERNLRLLNIRYPSYDDEIRDYLGRDPAHRLRRRLDQARLIAAGGRYVLLVSLGLEGGVSRAAQERVAAIRKSGLNPILLTPALDNPSRCNLSVDEFGYNDLYYDFAKEPVALTAFLSNLELDHIELHHFLDLPASLIERLFGLPCPIDIKIHDYIWYCPRITLLDKTGAYCGEPDIAACQSCIDESGGRLKETISVADLRARSAKWLRGARDITVPSESVATRMKAKFPGLFFRLDPLEANVPLPTPITPGTERIKVALIGAIGDHKGYGILLDMAKEAAKHDLPLDFVIIGFSKDDAPLIETGKVFVTGRYEEAEVADLIAREAPDVILFLSVFPESWCYSLTYALRAGIPVAAFGLGAIADRLRGPSANALLLPRLSGPAEICDRLLAAFELSRERDDITLSWRRKRPSRLINKPHILIDANAMPETANFLRKTMAQTDTAPTASVNVLPLTSGLFLFSVRSTLPGQRVEEQGGVTLPAMQIAAAPGAPEGQIQFMMSPQTRNGWLSEPNDQIVARVGSPALIMLTSVTIPGMTPLEIEIQRLGPPEPPAVANEPAQTEMAKASFPQLSTKKSVRLEVTAHVQNHGDLVFGESQWAGRIGEGFWVESFAVMPLEDIAPGDIEYMAVTATGVETPWISDGGSCGTRGIGVPLTALAIRARPGPATPVLTCEYGAILLSGAMAGPASNGALCHAPDGNDPIAGIWISINVPGADIAKPAAKRRQATAAPKLLSSKPVENTPAVEPVEKKKKPSIGPRFSVFRESGKTE